MAFDAALPIATPVFAPPLQWPQTRLVMRTTCMSAPFRVHEGAALTVGGLSLGALAGALMFFTIGRVEAWMPIAVALAAYVYAIHLVGLSIREVLAIHEPSAIGLFGLHVAALLAWPIMLLLCAPNSWLMWLGLPLALAASSLFLLITHAPASAMYRSSGHICLVVAIGAYQWLWTAMAEVA